MSTTLRALAVMAVFFVATHWHCLGKTGRGMNLCDALHEFDRYAGKVIEVEGDYIAGREVVGLYGHACKTPLVLDGATRPLAAAIREPVATKVSGEVVDFASIEKLQEAVDEHRSIASQRGLRVVLKGRLNSADEIPSYVDKNGKQRRMGFGHLGVFPFQIELISVRLIDNFEDGK